MTEYSERATRADTHRPLVSRAGMGLLGCSVVVMLCLLLPMAMRRQSQALEILPDALSLVYLDLTVARNPHDAELRLSVAKKTLEAGRFEAARAMLAPLLTPSVRQFQRAQELRLDIDRAAWAAVDPTDTRARAAALTRVIADIDAIDLNGAEPKKIERFASMYDSLAEPMRAAALLDALARRKLDGFEAHIEAAEAAHLRADQASQAVDLHVYFAETLPGEAGIAHALRALDLAPGALAAHDVLPLAERLRARNPGDPRLVAASLRLAESADVKLAFKLAHSMSKADPKNVELRRRVARLAEWNGNGLRALDEYVWLTRNGGSANDRAKAIDLARANWDLRMLRQLLRGQSAETKPKRVRRRARHAAIESYRSRSACGPVRKSASRSADRRRASLEDTLRLHEALGDTPAALRAVSGALRGALANDLKTLELQVALLQRAGRTEAALAAVAALAVRFPSAARSRELAQLHLRLGQTREALAALASGPEPHDEAYLRQLLELAWEAGDRKRTVEVAARIVQLPAANAWDVSRLWQLQRNDPDAGVPLATALAGFHRFKNVEMLRLVIASAERSNDDTQVVGYLKQAERFGGFRNDPSYWQQRITLHQKLAFAAFERQELVAAKRELGEAEKALERAPELAPIASELYQELWASQYAQVLSVALEAGDRAALARAFERYGARLPVRQRVYVLHRLDRHAEAFELARIGAADPRLSDSDRAALAADRPAAAAATAATDAPDYVRAHSELLQTDGMRLWTHEAELAIDGEALGFGFATSWSDLAPKGALREVQPEAMREIAGELRGRLWGTELTLGARVRDEQSPRPYGQWLQRVLGDRESGLSASVAMNMLTAESSQLRVAGATDELALQSSLAFGGGYYVTARAAGNRYLTLERDYLGAGLSVDGGVGRSFALPDDFGRVAMRVAGRFAPRLRDPDFSAAEDARDPARWIPETSAFAGVGASLARGELAIPRPTDPSFRFLLDGSIGVLLPNQRLGWTGQVGLGSALFGNDQLAAELIAGNVVGSEMFWVVQAGYAVGLE